MWKKSQKFWETLYFLTSFSLFKINLKLIKNLWPKTNWSFFFSSWWIEPNRTEANSFEQKRKIKLKIYILWQQMDVYSLRDPNTEFSLFLFNTKKISYSRMDTKLKFSIQNNCLHKMNTLHKLFWLKCWLIDSRN